MTPVACGLTHEPKDQDASVLVGQRRITDHDEVGRVLGSQIELGACERLSQAGIVFVTSLSCDADRQRIAVGGDESHDGIRKTGSLGDGRQRGF
jgi:hypothetical protein